MIAEETKLSLRVKKKSSLLEEYTNNLDSLLEIETVVDESKPGRYGLNLTGGKLHICGGDEIWDWYLVDKHPSEAIFKVVGLYKSGGQDLVYILGKHDNQAAFLIKLDSKYLESSSVKKCLRSLYRKPIPKFVKPSVIITVLTGVLASLIIFVVAPWIQSFPASVVETAAVSTPATEELSSFAQAMVNILPIVFAATIILGVLRGIGGSVE